MYGHKLPEKALQVTELIKIKELNISHNPIDIVEFKNLKNEDGTPLIGYFKKLNEKKSFSETLAKICVATSVFLGKTKGVAKEHLVYDKNKIVGTVSLELSGFIPFQGVEDKELKDPESQAMTNPTPEMLLDEEFIEKEVVGLIHHNYDFGPPNCGVRWLLDFEYFFPELTAIFKGERFNIHLFGYSLLDPIEKVIELTPEILRTFQTPLPYFPGQIPKNRIPGQSLAGIPNREFKTTAFKELLENEKYIPKAIYQRYAAYLKELLLFDRDVIKKHLEDYLGNEKLNLNKLPKTQQEALKKLEQIHLREKKLLAPKEDEASFPKLLSDENNQERSFADFFLTFLSHRHEKFRRVIIDMPELREHLLKLNTKEHFVPLFSPQTGYEPCHDAKKIFSCYQKILRDAFKTPILTHINAIQEIASEEIGFSKITMPKERIIELSMSCTSIDILPFLQKSKKLHLKDDITKDLKELANKIHTKFQNHYALNQPTHAQNQKFIDDLTALLTWAKNKKEYYEKIISSKKMNMIELAEITNIFEKLNKTLINFSQTLLDFIDALSLAKKNFDILQKTNSKQNNEKEYKEKQDHFMEEETAEIISIQEKEESILATDDKKLINRLEKILDIWLPGMMSTTFIYPLITASYQEYNKNASYYGRFFSRSLPPKEAITLSDIFKEDYWENNSMNTLFIKNICLTASGKTVVNDILRTKDNNWWARYAKGLAIASNLYQPKNRGLARSSVI